MARLDSGTNPAKPSAVWLSRPSSYSGLGVICRPLAAAIAISVQSLRVTQLPSWPRAYVGPEKGNVEPEGERERPFYAEPARAAALHRRTPVRTVTHVMEVRSTSAWC